MNFTEIFIRKPVLAVVVSLLLLMIGVVSYFKLPLRQFPKINTSVVSIQTSYTGASAKLMESYVSAPIERAVSGINGLDYITSSSSMNKSSVTLIFKLGYDIDKAVADVRDKLSTIKYKLPTGANDPVIIKQDPNVQPIIYLAFSSEVMSPESITDYLRRVIQPTLETIDGVANAKIVGERGYTMKIMLNPNLMAKNNVTAEDVMSALTKNHLHPPAGRIESAQEEFEVTAQTDVDSAKKFNHLVINKIGDKITRINDIGSAILGPNSVRSSVIVNNKPAVIIGIVPRSDGNPLTISDEINQALHNLKLQMPSDLQATIVWNSAKFIHASIHEVKRTIIEATVFVLIVMLLFLGSFRMLTIPMVTIPLSLIGICMFLLGMGFSLNTMTFLAMVLAIGLVVDDSIVVSENIHRHIESGMLPINAAIKGTNEIQFAIIAMTLTLAAVFLPIGFLNGLTGALFKEFAFTLAGTVIISGFIALVLSPMMCSKVMSAHSLKNKTTQTINQIFTTIANKYHAVLSVILKVRIIIPILLLLTIPLDIFLYSSLPKELAPKEDAGAILTIARGPTNANLNYMEKYSQQMNAILNSIPEKENVAVINGSNNVNTSVAYTTLAPWAKRDRSVQEIIINLNRQLWGISGISAFALNPYKLPGASGLMPIAFVLQTTSSYEDLFEAIETMRTKMSQSGLFLNIENNLKINTPKVEVDINRNLAGELGVPIAAIANAINIGLSNPGVTEFSMNGQNYDVVPELYSQFRQTPQDILLLNVRTNTGHLVPLSNLVTLKEVTRPKSLHHFNQLRSAQLTAGLAPGVSLGDAIDFLEASASATLKNNIQYNFAGESRQFLQANNAVMFTFIFALLFILLLLSAQFDSFVSPLIVICGLFFSITGALLALKTNGYSSNIYTQIGLVTLIGLISKHGILIVEFANQLRKEGKTSIEAVLEASKIRLRPILMTTAAMVLGALPLLTASGAGALSRNQLGLVIVSGMSFGTLMTIFVVPAMYMVIEDLKDKYSNSERRLFRSPAREQEK